MDRAKQANRANNVRKRPSDESLSGSVASSVAPLRTKSNKLSSLKSSAFEASDFDVVNLIAAVTEETVPPSATFDPQAYIQSFETVINQLLPLRQKVFGKVSDYEGTVAHAERQYNAKLGELKDNFQAVNTSFSSLEGRISEVGRTAIKIGDQLESIDKGKQRAIDAHDIIQYYFEFANGDSTNIERIRKEEGRDGRAKVAIIARRLAAVAKEVESMEGGEATRSNIEKYCEKFETDMLKLFDRYYRKGDPKGMAHCAKVLLDFNGGQSCVQTYVNQHDFFISKDRVNDASHAIDPHIWETLPDPNTPAPKAEPKLTALYQELKQTVVQEAQITQAVFPNPVQVMQVFLQRVFAQVIQEYIERLINAATPASTLAYLRILHLAHQSTFALIEDLKSIDLFKSAVLRNTITDRRDSTIDTTPAVAGLTMISVMLDQILEELFLPYMDGNRYMEKETSSLNELYAAYLLRFVNWHHSQQAGKPSKTVFDRMVNQLTQAAQNSLSNNINTSPVIGSESSSSMAGLKALLKLGNSSSNANGDSGPLLADKGLLQARKEDGDLDLHVAEQILRWHAEAVGRMVNLSPAADVPRNVFSLLRALADSYGRAYIETALDTALAQASTSDPKGATEPDLSLLELANKTETAMALWQKYLATALLPLASASLTVRREMGIFAQHVVMRIEQKVNDLNQRLTDNILSWIAVLLNRQRKTDFRPNNDDLAISTTNTEACEASADFVHRVKAAADQSLSGKNRENFLTEIGVAFHSQLLEHLKRFPVSPSGGLVLTRDLAVYQEALLEFNIAILSDRFDMLRQLGNVFVVRPEIIKSYMSESYLAKIEGRLIRPFLMQREDYGQYSKRFWDDVTL